MTVVFEGAAVSFAVTKLLNKVLETVELAVQCNKHCEALRNLLLRLQPLVTRIISGKRPASAELWLASFQSELQKADAVVQECTKLSRLNVIKSIPTSKKLIGVTNGIGDLLKEAGIVVLNCMLLNSEKHDADATEVKRLLEDNRQYQIQDKRLDEMRSDLNKMMLSQVTRDAVSRSAGNFGSALNTIGASQAFSDISNQAYAAAAVTTHDESSGRGQENVIASSSSAAARRQPRGLPKMVFGGDKVMEELKELLISHEAESSHWVGIWSTGGAGKTLTAERVYDDSSVQEHFSGGFFWLTVGRDRERTPLYLLQELLMKIAGKSAVNSSSVEETKSSVESILDKEEKVLLVLDDVWTSAAMECLDVVRPSSGSVILVTTRNGELLDKVFAKKLQIPMLSPEDSWQLFCWHAFRGVDNVLPVVENVAREVAGECKGLPLALKVIGGAMAGKSTREEWRLALTRLKNADVVSKEHEQQLFLRLQLSVDDLPGINGHLQDCFYYFAAFPEDAKVRVEDLISFWVGEGIVGSKSEYSPEDEAFELLGWLIARCLIELNSEKSPSYISIYMHCKIHDVLRDLIRYNLKHDLQVHQRVCLYQPRWQLKRFPEDWTSHPLSAQRLSVMYNDLQELPLELKAPRLRVLLVGYNHPLELLPKRFLGGLDQLMVLDLRSSSIKEIPGAALRSLTSLVLLNLSYCGKLEKIPDSIKYLKNLKELQISFCSSLKALPRGLRCLKSLRTLNVHSTEVWSSEQREISILGVTLFQGVSATIQDLSHLTALTDLRIYSPSLVSLPVSLNELKLLTRLHVVFRNLQSFPDINELALLEDLKLSPSKLTTLPSGIASLPSLRSLDLAQSAALSCLPALDELPLLEFLDLSGCQNLKQLPGAFGRPGAFPRLRELAMVKCNQIDVESFPDLQHGAMPQILVLNLAAWSQLRSLPASLQSLTTLRALNLGLCSGLESVENAFNSNAFVNLEEMDLSFTRLARLPTSLALLPKLETLKLRNCPAQDQLPVELQNKRGLQIRT